MQHMGKKWIIEFWDFGQWNVGAYGSWDYKAEAIAVVQKTNKGMTHE